jgi:hypothetical protein
MRGLVKREVEYFEDFGSQNTRQTIEAAKNVALNLALEYVVVATATGSTGVETAEAFNGTSVKVVVVTEYAGMAEFKEENRRKLKEMNAKVITSTHSFLSPAESISKLYTGYCSENTIIKVVKSCHSDDFFDKEKGMEFREIIAMPRKKKYW